MSTVALVLVIVLAVGVAWLAVMVLALRRQVAAVPEEGGVFEALRLIENELSHATAAVADLKPRLQQLEATMPHALQHTAVINYDAYGDVSGNLSRSIALLDANGNGLVVTLLVGREESRWFTKEVRDGRGSEQLSPEEQRAVSRAFGGTMPR